MTTKKITEIGVTFYKAGGHKHDGITSSLIDTSKYSIFDFDLAVSTDNGDTNRELRRQNNRTRFDQYVARFVTSQVLEPAGIVLPPDSVRGVNIGADEITANNIAANTITANEIAAGTITSNLLVTDFAVVNSTIRSNNFTYDAGNGTGNGWAIYSNGDAIFNNGTFSGKIDVGGLDTSSFHVDTGGNVWAGRGAIGTFGATSNATGAPFQVLASGNVSLAYGALQAFNNSVIRCNASLISFTGGSGTTLSVDGSISSTFNIFASGNTRALGDLIAGSYIYANRAEITTGGSFCSTVDGTQFYIDGGGVGTSVHANSAVGQTLVQIARRARGTNFSSNPSSPFDQILQIWNAVPAASSPKVTVTGLSFITGQPGGTIYATVLRSWALAPATPTGIVNIGTNSVVTGTTFDPDGSGGPLGNVNTGTGSGFDVGNGNGDGFGYVGAGAFVIRSSAIWKDEIEYMPKAERYRSIDRIKNLKPARWTDKSGFSIGIVSERFKDINKRWVERGKSPLTPSARHYEFREHDCSIDECTGNSDSRCPTSEWHHNRYGFIAEDVAEVFPKAVQFDGYNNPIGIDYAVMTYGLVETVQDLIDKIEDLENKLQKLSS